ncbi:lytic transglycosylase domain-containing protein [Pedobacter alpinus]|uniref:LysM peptidoglycan-binding domain-containing protein n=1 Tax=Pedobacter alpinus TaxID=1590643 RepID=A0ABW5TR17_9SPHI
MRIFGLGLSFLLFICGLSSQAASFINVDTLTYTSLSLKEARAIKKLISTDTTFVPAEMNLQLEIFKYNPNLIYKYRLDSIKTAINLDYNPYVQTYIDVFLTKRKAEMGRMVDLGKYYFPVFEKALNTYNIPLEFKYLPIIESSMDPMAVSRVGATGMWQFMYTTGKVYGLTIDNYVDERRDPTEASYAAARYLRDAYDELGDWLLALASYNCGKGNVTRAIAKANGSRNFWDIYGYLPSETRNYVPAFIAAVYMMNYYPRYPEIKVSDEEAIKTDSVYINKFIAFNKIAEVLNLNETDITSLNPVYKKNLVNGTLENPKRLIIPKLSYKDYAKFFEALNADEDVLLKVLPASAPVNPNLKISNTHTVAKGETLNAIANKYKVEVQDIKVWNNLDSYSIAIGQKLVIKKEFVQKTEQKKPAYLTYKVKAGDTLSDIAERFENVTINNIKALNNLKSSILTIGMILKITAP